MQQTLHMCLLRIIEENMRCYTARSQTWPYVVRGFAIKKYAVRTVGVRVYPDSQFTHCLIIKEHFHNSKCGSA